MWKEKKTVQEGAEEFVQVLLSFVDDWNNLHYFERGDVTAEEPGQMQAD